MLLSIASVDKDYTSKLSLFGFSKIIFPMLKMVNIVRLNQVGMYTCATSSRLNMIKLHNTNTAFILFNCIIVLMKIYA